MGHFAPATLEIKVLSKGHSAQYAADFYRFLDVRGYYSTLLRELV